MHFPEKHYLGKESKENRLASVLGLQKSAEIDIPKENMGAGSNFGKMFRESWEQELPQTGVETAKEMEEGSGSGDA